MASPWAHAIAGAAVGAFYQDPRHRRRVITLAAICAVAPDLDLIGWPLGISPSTLLGHRGLTHSLLFAVLLGAIAAAALRPPVTRPQRVAAAAVLILATATHGLIDALTTYAPTGPALWAPFSNQRYRFSWMPLTGSGGLRTDFGQELLYVSLPALVIIVAIEWWRRHHRRDAAVVLCLVLGALGSLGAQTPSWQPAPGHDQVLLWPGAPPGASPARDSESLTTAPNPVGGKPWMYIRNVSRPTLTVYSPKENNTGVAIVVFPGGGYQILAIDLEGTEACDWLTSRGVTCVLVKYRVPNAGPSWSEQCGCDLNTRSSLPLEDAQRTLGLVRLHAAEWHIDPHKIGVLGFSAGGHLVAALSTRSDRRVYPPVDAADSVSCRPDFAVALYPGHLWMPQRGRLGFNTDLHVTRRTPPTFLLQAETDSVDNVNQALVYYIALKGAGVPVEMHLYADGGHAFGLRRTKDPITAWPELVEKWLETIGMIDGRDR